MHQFGGNELYNPAIKASTSQYPDGIYTFNILPIPVLFYAPTESDKSIMYLVLDKDISVVVNWIYLWL